MSEEEQRICHGVSDKLLDSQVSDYHIAEIANDLVEWETLGPFFDLTESEQKEITEDCQGRYNLQKQQVLRVWRWKSGDKATYRALISICCSRGLVDLAEKIASYPGTKQRPTSSEILDTFHRYLLDCYLELPHPSRKQWPGNKLPMHAPTTFFDLKLLEAPLYENKMSGNNFKVVTLQSVLSKGEEQKRMLVYFEGIAGSGKTTLSWYACREWAQKRLLRDFQLLIHLQLNDPQIQSARSLPEIIPYPDKKLRQEIARVIVSCKGKGVCFLLDGLDEAPTNLLDFVLNEMFQGKLGSPHLPELSFVMTSRPDALVTKRLESVITSRILIAGFSGENLNKLLDDRLGATSEEREKLVEEFRINPRLEGLCSHPINAVIMTFLVHFLEKSTPTTQTDLFKPLVCNFLVRHVSTRLEKEDPCEIENLVDDRCIPPEIRKPFRSMCSLAYSSLIENRRLFTKKDINHIGLKDTLGFLHVRPTVTMFGSERYYSFAHLSVQEFLAAIHLAKMSDDEQFHTVKQLLVENPLTQVLSFYAGLTNLNNKTVLNILSKSLEQARDNQTVVERYSTSHGRSDPQQEVLAFMKCLFESKNESLLKLPETDLHLNTTLQRGYVDLCQPTLPAGFEFNGPNTMSTLSLNCLALSPIDCLSLGYYIHAKSFMPKQQTIAFDLNNCTIDHTGMRLLFTELKKAISHRTEVRVQLILAENKFHKESVLSLKELLQGQSNLEAIGLCNCFDPSLVDFNFALKCLIEGLSSDSSCGWIDLSSFYFESSHIYYFILMLLACPQIYWLDLKFYNLSKVMPLFCSALPFTALKSLDLSYCSISDSQLMQLGTKVSTCTSLSQLIIYNNPFTNSGLSNFLKLFLKNRLSSYRLTFLGIDLFVPRQLNQEQSKTLQEINVFRSMISRPFLQLRSYMNVVNFPNALKDTLTLHQHRKNKDRH